jgi:hypothetical protein
MRQIGARDEARLLGDVGHCGRPLCCQTFLRELEPVTMRMARSQKATLDPSKISGACGRLMCCLRYEDETYRDLKAELPALGTVFRRGGAVLEVVGHEVLARRLRLVNEDGGRLVCRVEEFEEAERLEDREPVARAAPATGDQANTAGRRVKQRHRSRASRLKRRQGPASGERADGESNGQSDGGPDGCATE